MSRRNSEVFVDETSVVLSAYLDPLLDDRRVLCVGTLPSSSIARIARIARSLRVLSTDTESVRGPRDVKITGTATATQVQLAYPFEFIVLSPVVRLVTPTDETTGAPITMSASTVMRNE